jgi:hypothetical protein
MGHKLTYNEISYNFDHYMVPFPLPSKANALSLITSI